MRDGALSPCYAQGESIDASLVGDRVVLYHRDSGKAIVLNPTGSWLWESLRTPQTPQTLAEQLCARFDSLSPQQAESDVRAYLQSLQEQSLLRVDTAA